MKESLGFIGVGNMGGPMAGRLLDAGYALTICDTREAALQPFVARGAKAAATPAAVASAVETVLVCLPTPDSVKLVATGPGGVAEGSKVGTFVDLSTTGPRTTQQIAQALRAKGVVAVDAPVSGGVSGAQKGTLAVMASGPREVFDRLRAVFEIIGKPFYLGEKPGLGQTMKLVNNMLSATALAITSEAMVMGVKAGLDPQTMLDVINAGSGRNSASQDKFPRAILPRTFDLGFTNALMFKDVRLFVEEAEAMGLPLWVATAVRELWFFAMSQLGPDKDFSTIVQCMEQWAKVEVKKREG